MIARNLCRRYQRIDLLRHCIVYIFPRSGTNMSFWYILTNLQSHASFLFHRMACYNDSSTVEHEELLRRCSPRNTLGFWLSICNNKSKHCFSEQSHCLWILKARYFAKLPFLAHQEWYIIIMRGRKIDSQIMMMSKIRCMIYHATNDSVGVGLNYSHRKCVCKFPRKNPCKNFARFHLSHLWKQTW